MFRSLNCMIAGIDAIAEKRRMRSLFKHENFTEFLFILFFIDKNIIKIFTLFFIMQVYDVNFEYIFWLFTNFVVIFLNMYLSLNIVVGSVGKKCVISESFSLPNLRRRSDEYSIFGAKNQLSAERR